ncbi:hypothetical protein IWW49_003144 [Coemansia sp. RSA 1797]|nr:hypothetical protein IWW49_003144 [Coemansia sp. RSA 1797]
MIDENEAIKAKRRDCLVEELGDYGEIAEFDDLLFKLQVENEYKAFQHRFRGIFAAMAFRAIAYVDRTAVQPIIPESIRTVVKTELTCDTDDSVHAHLRCFNLYQASKCFGMKHEHVLVQYIDEMLQMAKYAFDNQPSHERKTCNRIERTINPRGPIAHMFRTEKNGRNFILKLAWTPVKQLPESAVYDALKAANIPNIPLIIDSGIIIENSFGYRVEYLLIEDCGVPLVEYLQTQMLLGISKQSDIAASAMFQAVECIYSAWNAGILHRDITADSVVVKGDQVRIIDWGYTKLVKDGPVDVDALATKWLFNKDNATGDEGSSAPIIGTPLYTSIPVLVGATQRSIADDVESVLYLAWAPVDQLPESAVYDALKAANIPNIPLIIDSGIIIENSFGYRVEYLLIEDCGISLTKYLLTQSHWDMKWMSDNAAKPMSQIVECIYNAWNAGILHRDISASNILVKGGHIRIIDWGSATLLENSSIDIDAIETKWLFKKETDKYNKYKPDSAGTSLYKSIPVLIGATQRSIVDDIESALYVVLESVFKTRPDNLKVEPIALRLESEQSLAFVRGCCLSDVDYYRQAFGIPYCSERFAWLMDTFREYLFVRNDEYIGSKLAMQPLFERTVEIQQLERILEQIKERVFGESPVSNTGKKQSQVGKSSTSVKALRCSKRVQSKKRRR